MRTHLYAGIGSGVIMSGLLVAGLTVALGTAAPAAGDMAVNRVAFCHLQDKVDPNLLFNDGRVIEVSKASCRAHCMHGDHPMPVPFDNNAHPNRQCARIHISDGLPSCEVNTPSTVTCSVDACLARCEAT